MPPVSPAERPSAAAWSLLALLVVLNVLNFVDRNLISSVAPFLISELGLTRAQIGLLQGFGFVVFYTVMGVILGAAADRWHRPRLIAAGLTLWSAVTAISGLAQSFVHLLIPRMFVGAGEATLTPASLSMLAETFPASRRAFAVGAYYAGVPIGAGLGLVIASVLVPTLGWRSCFYVLGGVGLLFVVALLFVKEPREVRREAGAVAAAVPSLASILADLRLALRSSPALWLVMVGGSGVAYASGAAIHAVTWIVQERDMPFAQVAFRGGVIIATAGLTGNFLGGWFADWCRARWAGGRIWSLAISCVVFAPISLLFVFASPDSPMFYVLWFLTNVGLSTWYGPVFAATQDLAPPSVRASIIGVALLVTNVLGVSPGAYVTGLIGDTSSLTQGLIVSIGVSIASAIPFALAARRVDQAAVSRP